MRLVTRSPRAFDPEATALRLAAGRRRKDRLTHLELRPSRGRAGWRRGRPGPRPSVVDAYARPRRRLLWSHQADAAELAWSGQHVVVATGTASGKSLAYLLPALSAIAASVDKPGARGDTVLYLSPTKALAQDQLGAMRGLDDPRCPTRHVRRRLARARSATGPAAMRTTSLTNPDMLHRTMLPVHARWSQFWGALRYVVVDECHHYRGVFGAHVAQILRRLRRVAAHYGSIPDVRARVRDGG